MTVKFDEKRYAQEMLDIALDRRNLAEQLGGDVAHYDRLIALWTRYLEQLQ